MDSNPFSTAKANHFSTPSDAPKEIILEGIAKESESGKFNQVIALVSIIIGGLIIITTLILSALGLTTPPENINIDVYNFVRFTGLSSGGVFVVAGTLIAIFGRNKTTVTK